MDNPLLPNAREYSAKKDDSRINSLKIFSAISLCPKNLEGPLLGKEILHATMWGLVSEPPQGLPGVSPLRKCRGCGVCSGFRLSIHGTVGDHQRLRLCRNHPLLYADASVCPGFGKMVSEGYDAREAHSRNHYRSQFHFCRGRGKRSADCLCRRRHAMDEIESASPIKQTGIRELSPAVSRAHRCRFADRGCRSRGNPGGDRNPRSGHG